MHITDNVLRERLKNVYFLWGRGKTTIASELQKRHGVFVYHTDESRDRQMEIAVPAYQPYMCRDYVAEYGVKSFWALPPEVIADREKHVLAEMTPMMTAELIALSARHDVVICEGDIDYASIAPIATHMLYLWNCGTMFDWFDRPDHSLDAIKNRTDLTESEKQEIIDNAYLSVAQKENVLPDWVIELGVPYVRWDDSTGVAQTADDAERIFGLWRKAECK